MKKAMKKYIKPKSLTWIAGAIPLASGLIIAGSKMFPQLEPVASVLTSIYDGATPGVLINGGIAAIGLRGAMSSAQ